MCDNNIILTVGTAVNIHTRLCVTDRFVRVRIDACQLQNMSLPIRKLHNTRFL